MNVHNLVHIPENRVGVIIFSWIKPEVVSLFSVSLSSGEDIGLHDVRLSSSVTQELKIYLIML